MCCASERSSARRGIPTLSAGRASPPRSRGSGTSRHCLSLRGASSRPGKLDGPASGMEDGTVLVDEPCREVACLEPVERAVAEDDRGRACGVGLDARAGGNGRRPPRAGRRAAGAGVDDVVAFAACCLPAAHRRARGRKPARGERDGRARLVERGRCGRRRCGSASRLRAAYPRRRCRLRATRGRPSRCGRPPRRRCGRPRPPWPWRPRSSSTPAGRQTVLRIARRARSRRSARQARSTASTSRPLRRRTCMNVRS